MILLYCFASFCLLGAEFLIILTGKTLFNDRYNLMMVGAHICGLVVSYAYESVVARYTYIRIVWLFASFIPFMIEGRSLM